MADIEPKDEPPLFPRATLRLQFHKDFGFADATPLVPYFAALGVSHIYASPFLMARAGSLHGYDIIDHTALNPEIGDDKALDELVAALHRHGMGLILDFVPNHMGVGGADNPWWLDVLEWGQASPYAGFFDIDWAPPTPRLKGKVLLPFLGDHYGHVLERGELTLRFDAAQGTFSVWYYDHRFPIAVRDYARILGPAREALGEAGQALAPLIDLFGRIDSRRRSVNRQAVIRREAAELKSRLAVLAGEQPAVREAVDRVADDFTPSAEKPGAARTLHSLLERQAYTLAFWRVAADEINYRRFFDINDLAALCMEQQELFEISHRLIFRLVAEGRLQGLRIDHIDGLYDPADYCRRLQTRAAYLGPRQTTGLTAITAPGEPSVLERLQPLYLLVEKILARHEHLRPDWPIDGSTGYDFLNLVNGLFVDPRGERALTQAYHRVLGREVDFAELVVEAKRQIVQSSLAGETSVLANELYRLAQQSWSTRDYTLTSMRRALIEVLAHFPVYRTYITAEGIAEEDRRYLDWAIAQARKASSAADLSIFDFIYAVLTTDLRQKTGLGYRRRDIVRTAMRFQQFSGPVMAKSFEDTALYRYHRLISLNDVGGEPERFGVSPNAFHFLNQERGRRYPFAMLATATHDHKRGEDVRVRIDVLSELPAEWGRRVRRWIRMNRRRKRQMDEGEAPGRNDEYLLYQTLVGAWPLDAEGPSDPSFETFVQRIADYMIKAVREAKRQSSWNAPNEEYEEAVTSFVRAILSAERNQPFLDDLADFQSCIAVAGALNGLSQTLLKLTVPGVPDIYQGCELWDLSLVDPDNRRPVDFKQRMAFLSESPPGPDPEQALLQNWRDGRIKQHVVARALALRGKVPQLFATGDYQPLEVGGEQSERAFAFARSAPESLLVTVVPRLVLDLLEDCEVPLVPRERWGDTWIGPLPVPDDATLIDVMTGRSVRPRNGRLGIAELLDSFPVSLLSSVPP